MKNNICPVCLTPIIIHNHTYIKSLKVSRCSNEMSFGMSKFYHCYFEFDTDVLIYSWILYNGLAIRYHIHEKQLSIFKWSSLQEFPQKESLFPKIELSLDNYEFVFNKCKSLMVFT